MRKSPKYTAIGQTRNLFTTGKVCKELFRELFAFLAFGEFVSFCGQKKIFEG